MRSKHRTQVMRNVFTARIIRRVVVMLGVILGVCSVAEAQSQETAAVGVGSSIGPWPMRGLRGFAGVSVGVGQPDFFKSSVTYGAYASFGYQLNNVFYIGGGVQYQGVSAEERRTQGETEDKDYNIFTVFANPRIEILKKKVTPFVDSKVGYSVTGLSGVYLLNQTGVRINRVNFAIGYESQWAKATRYHYGYSYDESIEQINTYVFTFAFDFGKRR